MTSKTSILSPPSDRSSFAAPEPTASQVRSVRYPLTVSEDFRLRAGDRPISCHWTRVYNWRNPRKPKNPEQARLAEIFDFNYASLAWLECEGPVEVRLRCTAPIGDVSIRPLSYQITARVEEDEIVFIVRPGQKISVEPHGDTGPVLHLFADLPETDIPHPEDPDVLYFGPGLHERASLELRNNQTLYLAPGAVLKAVIGENEPFERIERKRNKHIDFSLRHLHHFIHAWDAKNIRIRGRGIMDTSAIADAFARKNPISLNRCEQVEISGITILEATCWTITLYRCSDCRVENVKTLSAFANSDGVNTVSSRDVVIRDCFLRNRDDGIAIKSMDTGNTDCFLLEPAAELKGGAVENVLVEKCVIWSDWGYAFGATYEIRKPIRNVVVRDCDVVHATHPGPQGVIGILVSDRDHVSDMLFENIRVERALKPLIDMRILVTPWTVDPNLGTIHDITFRDIFLLEPPPPAVLEDCKHYANKDYYTSYCHLLKEPSSLISLRGLSEKSHIRDIRFENIHVNGNCLSHISQLEILPHVENVSVVES